MENRNPIDRKVLIVDDDLADAYLLQKALRTLGLENVFSVTTADEASKFIVGLSPYEHRWLPHLIFVDLKITGTDGFQLINWLQRNPLFKDIPLIVFSGSSDPGDRQKAFELGAKAFYRKTAELAKLREMVQEILNMSFEPLGTERLPDSPDDKSHL